MPCPHCAASTTAERLRRTAQGYRIFRCGTCCRAFAVLRGISPLI
jgi:transposase-like protein